MDVTLKGCFGEPLLNVMNFLNEVVSRYPEAISFAPGRPAERFFDVEASLGEIGPWVDHHAAESGVGREKVLGMLGQYGRTNGIIADLVARHLELDEGIAVDPEAVMITVGCQEAMTILLAGLFEPPRDVLLATDPTYIGITGLARILGVPVRPVPLGEEGLEPAVFAAAVREARGAGLRPRALYDVPDFNNPLGTSMPPRARREILDIAHREGVLVFEDNPYGMFAYDGEPQPTLKSLDEHRDVIYMGTFSKTLYPSLRVGYLVADQPVAGGGTLAAELSKVKSLTTVNTPPLLQALVGGILLASGGSLKPLMADKLAFYRANRDTMLACLERHLGPAGRRGIHWNRPGGGFFLTVGLPFVFDEECLARCARDYGVICCPMSFFSLSGGRGHQIRLSFSYVTPAEIEEGIARLARFLEARLAEVGPTEVEAAPAQRRA